MVATTFGIMARYTYAPTHGRHAERMSWFDFTDASKRRPKWTEPEQIVRCGDDVPLYEDAYDKVPRYTSEWAAAGPIAERFESMELEAVYSILDPTVPTTRRVTLDLGGASVSGHAATSPTAICIAALAAQGIPVEIVD